VRNGVPGPEAAKSRERRMAEGFFARYLSGDAILDIGYRGGNEDSVPITEKAIGVELDYPGYDGTTLPFPSESQDAVFASHCLEHIEEYRSSIAEWYRVLRIGGYLIIAVPHKYLYERKAAPPSRFNLDHKRFYTPQTLISELEEALPLEGYRVRLLREIDDGFDYSISPEQEPRGCYEIECVVQKIAIPPYAELLRPSAFAEHMLKCFTAAVQQAILARRKGADTEVAEIQGMLRRMPLPPYLRVWQSIDCEGTSQDEVKCVMRPLIEAVSFSEKWYLERNPDVAEEVSRGRLASARAHFISSGYFESRSPSADTSIFDR
jgi:SAM-dependent methyltransferase